MQLTTSSKSPQGAKADLLVLVLTKEAELFDLPQPEIRKVVKELRAGVKAKNLRREPVLAAPAGFKARYVMFAMTELVRFLPEADALRSIGARAVRTARDMNLSTVAFATGGSAAAEHAAPLVEGAVVGAYGFEKYRQKPRAFIADLRIEILAEAANRAAVDRAARGALLDAETINRCRDLVNEPGGVAVPEFMAQAGRDIAKRAGLGCEVWDERRLAREGYRGLIQVGSGSTGRPPRLIVIRYRPKKIRKGDKTHLALVGKGLTFDTGGISIKPANHMWMMKGDMAGGAACLYAMELVARMQPAIPVTCVVTSAENFPGPHAQLPGDIFVARNGKSIHVDNTDAEGRLVLTDGLYHAGREGATHIVDVATLTGSCVRALGTSIAGVMGTDRDLVSRVIDVGRSRGEGFWELPLHEEYMEYLEFPIADINNVGGMNAGAITAGLFLKEFVPEGAAWAHLDIAGTFIAEKPWRHFGPGATGFAVKTLAGLAQAMG